MKIHDKFVIELAEVIKGYGNDYRVKDPFNLPCYYRFYEIDVAICDDSFRLMKPLGCEINVVLDKIRAEIDHVTEIHSDGEFYIKNIDVKRIIDKYKAESEDKE